MSAFKDATQQDIHAVFLNGDEFAETHNIDGKDVVVMLDIDRMLERRDKVGLSSESLYFYVAASDLPARPLVDSVMFFDDVQYIVTECPENDGVLEIALMRENVGMRGNG